jgi:anti-sigma factor RsiW
LNCEQTRELLHAYLDGELDLAHVLEIERHTDDCPTCARARDELLALRAVVRCAAPRFLPPERLRQRLQDPTRPGRGPAIRSIRPLLPFAAAASLAAAFFLGWLASRAWDRPSPSGEELLAGEVVASHVRSLMANHLTDVASSNKHEVKPWFDTRVDFAVDVYDFSKQEFPLDGGRLDYLGNRKVAALVYKRRLHVINLFVWPTDSALRVDAKAVTGRGYHLFRWAQGGMTYWVISDLNEEELQEFVRLIQAQAGP